MACKWNSDIWVPVTLTMLLLLEGLAGMVAQMTETSLEMHTTGRIPCNHNFPDGSFDAAKWTQSTSDHNFVNGGEALVKWNHNVGVTSNDPAIYDMIDTDLSLVIKNVSLEDAGIYRCTVFPINLDDEISESDNKLSVYKQPDYTPVLTYHIQGDEIIFNCSVGTVFPLNFPEFPYPYQNNHTIQNEDGTYVASVSAAFQYDGSRIQVECSYSYRNQHWHSSLTTYRDNRDGHVMTTESGPRSPKYSTDLSSTKGQNSNHPPAKGLHSILWWLIIVLILIIWLFLVIVWKISVACWRRFGTYCRSCYQGDKVKGDKKDTEFSSIKIGLGTEPSEKRDSPAEMGYKKAVPTKQKIDAQQPEQEDTVTNLLEELCRAMERGGADLEHRPGNQFNNSGRSSFRSVCS